MWIALDKNGKPSGVDTTFRAAQEKFEDDEKRSAIVGPYVLAERRRQE